MELDRALEGVDLSYALTILAMLGFFMAIIVNQQTRYEGEDADDPWYIRITRLSAYALLAWSFLWVLNYAEKRGWQPWPPVILMIFAMDSILIIRAMAIKAHIRRRGIRPESPRAAAEGLPPLRKVHG